MKRFLLSVVLFFGFAAHSKTIECIDSEEAGFKLTATFDSSKPALTSSIITYNPDGTIEHESKLQHLTPKIACNTDIDYAADCVSSEKQGALGYSFVFNCKSMKLSGEFYVDENGNASFSCNNIPGASLFFGCTEK